jgi:hypothetical protein
MAVLSATALTPSLGDPHARRSPDGRRQVRAGSRPPADLTWYQGLHDRALWAGTASPGRAGSAPNTSRPLLSSHDSGQDPADDQL